MLPLANAVLALYCIVDATELTHVLLLGYAQALCMVPLCKLSLLSAPRSVVVLMQCSWIASSVPSTAMLIPLPHSVPAVAPHVV